MDVFKLYSIGVLYIFNWFEVMVDHFYHICVKKSSDYLYLNTIAYLRNLSASRKEKYKLLEIRYDYK